MFVDDTVLRVKGKEYRRVLIRDSYRENGKIKHHTIANISKSSDEEIEAIKFALKNKGKLESFVSLEDIKIKTGFSVGAIVLLEALARRLHITQALGRSICPLYQGNSRMGKLALWQVMARVIDQGSRLSAVRLASQHAICDLIGLDSFNEDDLYKNLDWLADNQGKIEKKLFDARYCERNAPNLYLYDVTSSYLEGCENELADWGYNRDKKKGKMQVVIGLLTDGDGAPVSVEVFKGNTSDCKTFFSQIKKVSGKFGIKDVTMVGDRGMIKSAQIKALGEEHFHYITAITKSQIEVLVREGVIQFELFEEKVCEVEAEGIRYILRRNPIRAREIERTREKKLDKIKEMLEAQNKYLLEHKRAKVKSALNKIRCMIQRLKLSDFCKVYTGGRVLSIKIDEEKRKEVSRFDGCYVLKTDLRKDIAGKEEIHARYKDLTLVEDGFRTIKTGVLEVRPVNVQKEKRTRGHVFVVMLGYSIVHELKKIWAGVAITMREGIRELTDITGDQIKVGSISYQQIPEPRDLGAKLLSLAGVSLPVALPYRGVKVATRKKLVERRKK